MHNRIDGLSTEEALALQHRIDRIVAFWGWLRVGDDPGQTSWEELDSLEREVTECLQSGTPADISRAESLTAQASFLMTGQYNL
ncbi:hypothetical protein [Lacipirellula parvula]|uniref:Uncharacterized protein n=1 Tax=Lacipirellula parvula TaxID=2650471 RepID=A0A5K7XJ16_9BACT|nr:hypothetical protein [Lacipirellula parvula]BBO34203.1 hypothetical protein PLANPX_3815 [Lacipirellula parvula]